MINKLLKNSLKVLLLLLVLTASFHFAQEVLAGPEPSTPSLPQVSSVESTGLSGGGTGLQIAGTEDVQISGDIQKRPLADVVKSMVNYFIGFLGFIAVISFVYAGVLWVVSGGNDEQITKARKIMTYSALGLVVVLLSYSIVTFITSSAGLGEPTEPEGGGYICQNDTDCGVGFVCTNGLCNLPPGSGCLSSLDCGPGQYCSFSGTCMDGNSLSCNDNSDCSAPKQCDPFGFCHNPNAGSGSTCTDNTDCPTGYVCNGDSNSCEIQGTGGMGGVSGGETQALSEEALNDIDETVNGLGEDLEDIENESG